jgi:predicted aconitase with swiveling domain
MRDQHPDGGAGGNGFEFLLSVFRISVFQKVDPARKQSRTIHHQGEGEFMVAGRTLHLPSPKTSLAGK